MGLFLTLTVLVALISLALDRPKLTVRRSLNPDAVAIGESATVTVTVRNQAVRPSPLSAWRDFASAGIEVHGVAPFPRLAEHRIGGAGGNDTAVLSQRIRARRRGEHEVGPLIVSRSDPFGLATADFPVGRPEPILVTPRVSELPRGSLDSSRSEGTEHELLRHSIPSADELIARGYRAGDPLRRVHWRATARHDKLMVRQEEQRSSRAAWILFDTHGVGGRETRTSEQPADQEFETAVEILASVGVHLLGEGFDLRVIETGARQLAGRSRGGQPSSLGGGAPTYEGVGAERTLITDLASIVQTASARDDSVAELGAELRQDGRGVPVFAVLGEADLDEIGTLAGLRSLAEPAVAFVSEHADRRAIEALVASGWNCVTVRAGAAVSALWQAALSNSEVGRRG